MKIHNKSSEYQDSVTTQLYVYVTNRKWDDQMGEWK